jgi:hypothetical protein
MLEINFGGDVFSTTGKIEFEAWSGVVARTPDRVRFLPMPETQP